jgi:hypothetical protein
MLHKRSICVCALLLLISLQVDVESCYIKGAPVYHKDDSLGFKERLTHIVGGKVIHIEDIFPPEDSELCGVLNDMLKQAANQQPDNYSMEAREQVGVDMCCGWMYL